jgi:ribosomal protein L7/L12
MSQAIRQANKVLAKDKQVAFESSVAGEGDDYMAKVILGNLKVNAAATLGAFAAEYFVAKMEAEEAKQEAEKAKAEAERQAQLAEQQVGVLLTGVSQYAVENKVQTIKVLRDATWPTMGLKEAKDMVEDLIKGNAPAAVQLDATVFGRARADRSELRQRFGECFYWQYATR